MIEVVLILACLFGGITVCALLFMDAPPKKKPVPASIRERKRQLADPWGIDDQRRGKRDF